MTEKCCIAEFRLLAEFGAAKYNFVNGVVKILSCRTFHCRTFCLVGRFVVGGFVVGRFVVGRFVVGRFVCESSFEVLF